ncbi:MAG: Ig-like domain-containing protein [Gemmatimonadota bacterium]
MALALTALAACRDASSPARAGSLGLDRPAASVSADPGVVFIGAGDIAECTSERDELSAQILDTIPGTVFTLGDNAYESGTAAEYADCYAPTWGRHKDRTWPTSGNHEYRTAEGAPYYEYFGARAGTPGQGYYSYDLGDWHIVSLNSNIDMSEGSDQERWLRSDLVGRADQCVLAYWHDPRFSSGLHGNRPATTPLWRALYDAGAEIVLSGHDHDYERFAPQTPDGSRDNERGIREFVVGTGGTSLRPMSQLVSNSEARNNKAQGVLKLTLYAGSYEWEFIPIAGDSYHDAGSGTCHGVANPEPPATGTIDVRVASSTDDAEESASGDMSLHSKDLELVNDGSDQTVGLRFVGVTIPRGAAITNAYVQFQAIERNTGPDAVTIAAQATDFAKPFNYTSGNISSRPRSAAAVAWTPPAWSTIGAAGPDERTPNLAAVLQEIVNRPGWMSGSALALIITGTGRRVAESYDGSPAAPLLHVEFQSPDAGRSSVTSNTDSVPADGRTTAVITVTLRDRGDAPVVGRSVTLSENGKSVISAPSGSSDANGQVTFTVTNTTAETVTYTATDLLTGLTISQTAEVTFIPTVDADRSTVTSNLGTVTADGASGATITVTLLDRRGAPVVGHGVSLAQTGSSGISAPSGLSNANGQVMFTVTSTTPETVTYTATDLTAGVAITQTVQLTFKVKTVLEVRIATKADDAEESAAGEMYLASTDLEMTFDYTTQTVGLRFAAVAIPPGATIARAFLQLQTDEANAGPVALTIGGQATNDAKTFTWATGDISSRPRTSAAVAWAPPAWSILDEEGAAQRTPDLATVIQEIVNRPGWQSGNALVLIITGTGKRVAKSYDGMATAAPMLHVEFSN